MKARRLWPLAVLAGAVLPVMARAPRNEVRIPEGVRTVADAVVACRESGRGGWELVDFATDLVHRKYAVYSCYHWWETPDRSFERSRGQANQYNSALAHILRELGFHVRTVHAARVRLDKSPWFHVGHTWLEVTVDGRCRDVCASRAHNRAGDVAFTPMTPVRPFRGLTYVDTTLGLAPICLLSTWRAWLTGRGLPQWMYRPFGEDATA